MKFQNCVEYFLEATQFLITYMLLFLKLPDQSKLKMTTICVKIYIGGEIQYKDDGVYYSTRVKYSIPLTVNHSFDYLLNEIYKLVGVEFKQCKSGNPGQV